MNEADLFKTHLNEIAVNKLAGWKAIYRSGKPYLFLVVSVVLVSGSFAQAANKCSELLLKAAETNQVASKTYEYGGYKFSVREMSNEGRRFEPATLFDQKYQAMLATNSKVVDEVGAIWNKGKFAEAREPLRVGSIQNRKAFQTDLGLRILDLPIKMAGNNEYRIPKELLPFAEEIKRIVDHFHKIAPPGFAEKAYAYITIDQGYVDPGKTQRKGGAHVDGFQGARIQPKNELNYSYIASNLTPTAFYRQPFELSKLDERVHDHFVEMDRQKKPEAMLLTNEFDVYLINAYSVHEATEAKQAGFRTFLRISFDVKEFDRLGNTHNPMFDYKWGMAPRETQSGLLKYQPLGAGLNKVLNDMSYGRVDESKLKTIIHNLKSTDIERFYNFSFEAIKLDKTRFTDLVVRHLFEFAKKDLKALRILFVAATRSAGDVHTRGAFIQALKAQKAIVKANLYVDLLMEVGAYDKTIISESLWQELTANLSDPRL
jgi:hypothetical protein